MHCLAVHNILCLTKPSLYMFRIKCTYIIIVALRIYLDVTSELRTRAIEHVENRRTSA
jgi:hypothetical protein